MASDIMRLVYKRGELVKYVSHLDFVKVFERAIRRAGIEVAFSGGFNPRMLLVFGNPLPVGYTSSCELLDITFAKPYKTNYIAHTLNKHLPGDIAVVSASALEKPYASILQTVSFAGYEGKIEGLEPGFGERLNQAFNENETIFTMKRSKSGEKNVDIKPMIKEFVITGGTLKITALSGQEGSLRPELALEAVSKLAGISDLSLVSVHKTMML
ncbi:MAG: DUF2344 domain-containing protein [Clostridia bacterium]|nr:DUF2344 domain-containing protein [Clostridia bacterium]